MARIAIFSKYFGYAVGGAERSVLQMLKREQEHGHEIIAYVNADPRSFSARDFRMALPKSWELRPFTLSADFSRFRFTEYLINRPGLERLASQIDDADVLWSYGTLAPAIIKRFCGASVYLVRDEYGLGWNKNYYAGARAALQTAYHLAEGPARAIWKRDLSFAIKRSRLIANSNFIAHELRQISPPGAVIETIPSTVDVPSLRAEFASALRARSRPAGIVVIGDNALKGGDIARKIANAMPSYNFYVFDRRYTEPLKAANLTFLPWAAPGDVYAHAAAVLVPSRWAEAFPRAVLEAQALNIPVVASTRGGIPEAIDDKEALVDELENIELWVTKLSSRLRQGEYSKS